MTEIESPEEERPRCFYCSALIAEDTGAGDHFPIPHSEGGTQTVPCCTVCHNMKDRFSLYDWPAEWISVVLQDFPRMSRETRLFLAKCINLYARKYNK